VLYDTVIVQLFLFYLQVYEFCVLEVLPGKAVSIIECDMKVR